MERHCGTRASSLHSHTHTAVCYLNDVLDIELHIKGEFNVVAGKDALLRLSVAAQATEGAGVARLLLVDATNNQ